MNIPDEAVAAAWRAALANDSLRSMWRNADLEWRESYKSTLRAALEAAAPFLMEQAWDEGRRTGSSRAMRHMSDEPSLPLKTENPYRVHMPRSAITGRYKTKGDQK